MSNALPGSLICKGLLSRSNFQIPVQSKGTRLDCGYRIDILVEDQLILELKSVNEIKGIYEAQLLTYMKLASIPTGLLINFHVEILKEGIKHSKF